MMDDKQKEPQETDAKLDDKELEQVSGGYIPMFDIVSDDAP